MQLINFILIVRTINHQGYGLYSKPSIDVCKFWWCVAQALRGTVSVVSSQKLVQITEHMNIWMICSVVISRMKSRRAEQEIAEQKNRSKSSPELAQDWITTPELIDLTGCWCHGNAFMLYQYNHHHLYLYVYWCYLTGCWYQNSFNNDVGTASSLMSTHREHGRHGHLIPNILERQLEGRNDRDGARMRTIPMSYHLVV